MRTLTTAALTAAMAFGSLLGTGAVASANALAGNGYSSSYAGESVFENRAAGEGAEFTGIFANDGIQPWASGIVGLLVCLADKVTCNVASPNAAYASGWYSDRVYATVSTVVNPGQNGFFSYKFKVPQGTPASTAVTFNGDVGLIATGTMLRPEGYYQINTTPISAGTLTISPTSATMAVGGQQQFTATTSLTGTVAWSVEGGCGAVTAQGMFVATATNSASQPCSVKASIGGLSATAPITVFGSPTQLACSASPAGVIAGGGPNGVTTLTITVKDSNGNTVATSTPAISVTNATPSLATLSASGSLAATNGVLAITVTSTASTGDIVISASSASSISGCTARIPSTAAGAAAKTASSFDVSPIGADAVSTARLRVDIQDANSNRVTTDSSTVIDVSVTSGASICTVAGVFTGTSGAAGGGSGTATAVQGRVEFTVRSTNTPGDCVITATPRTTSIAGSSATLTTKFQGAPTQLSVTANDSPHAAGSASLTKVTVALRDALGTIVTSSTTPITATLDTSTCMGAGGGNVVLSSSGATTGGRAEFRFTSNGAYSGCSVTFTATGVSSTTTTMVFTAGAADHLGCVFSPSQIVKDGSSISVGLVKLRDQANNDVTTGSYQVNFSRTSGDGVTTLVTTNPQTMSNGVASFTVRSTTTVGTDTYTPSLSSGTLPNVVANTGCQVEVVTSVP